MRIHKLKPFKIKIQFFKFKYTRTRLFSNNFI